MSDHVLPGPTDCTAYSLLVFAVNTLQLQGQMDYSSQTFCHYYLLQDLSVQEFLFNDLNDLNILRELLRIELIREVC